MDRTWGKRAAGNWTWRFDQKVAQMSQKVAQIYQKVVQISQKVAQMSKKVAQMFAQGILDYKQVLLA